MAGNPAADSNKGKAGWSLVLVSSALMAFLAYWESGGMQPILIAYADRLAGGLPTVCDGLTRHITETPIIVGQAWTLEQCHAETERAVRKVQKQLLQCFTREPPQAVFDAATSHAWNNGAGATCGSVAMKRWNEGKWAEGCKRLQVGADGRPVWSYVRTGKLNADGTPQMRFVQGLANRRGAERSMCEAWQ